MQRYLASSKASAKSIAETYGILSEDLAAIVWHDYPLPGKLFGVRHTHETLKIYLEQNERKRQSINVFIIFLYNL